MKDKRPVNLAITTIKLPLAAIASFLHRVSGAFLFLAIAFLLYLLQQSLASEAGFAQVESLLSGTAMKFTLWTVLSALAYHFVAGIKHLLLDMGFGESREGAKIGASVVILVAAVMIGTIGVWLW